MIDGYAQNPSVVPGDRLELRVSTAARAFRVELFRWGREVVRRGGTPWLQGRHAPHHLPYQDWGRDDVALDGRDLPAWAAYDVPIPLDWPSGPYVAVLIEGDGDGRDLDPRAAPRSVDARHGRALFVVRSARPGTDTSILYKLPLLTYHAYNRVTERGYDPVTGCGGWSLYTIPEPHALPPDVPRAVSVRRPGGGTGGTPSDWWSRDPFDPTPRQTFVHWDAWAVAWLEASGYRADYCADLDLHEDGAAGLLAPYRLLLGFGHDEYWSAPMRSNVERFVRGGGNAAFFGGNTCWWEVAFDEPFAFRRAGLWSDAARPGGPENDLTGVSFRNGGERPPSARPEPVGFRVQHADHWVYAGTGLRDGDVFGAGEDEHLVGYECDGAHFDRHGLRAGGPVRPSGEDGTPEDFAILGVGDVGARGWGEGNRAATLGVHAPGGTVFTASTTDWPRVLAGGSAAVAQITRNVLDRLSVPL